MYYYRFYRFVTASQCEAVAAMSVRLCAMKTVGTVHEINVKKQWNTRDYLEAGAGWVGGWGWGATWRKREMLVETERDGGGGGGFT